MTWKEIKDKIESMGIQNEDEIASITLPDLMTDSDWDILENMGIWEINS